MKVQRGGGARAVQRPRSKETGCVGLCPSLLNSIHVCLMGIENSSVTGNVIDSADS